MPQPSTSSELVDDNDFAHTPSRRRTTARHGFVNFPIDDPRFRNSGEGGMFVKLVVVDDRDYDKSDWTICCAPGITDHLGESLIADDQAPRPILDIDEGSSPEHALEVIAAHDVKDRAWVERHFPRAHQTDEDPFGAYTSRPYLAALMLGITGWSGFDEAVSEYWCCSHDSLTDEGRALYAQLQALYPGCTLHLLTYLDT